MASLCITIPTYNRKAPLISTIKQLSAEDGIHDCRVIVVDNASDVPVANYLAEEIASLRMDIEIIRNVANLGLSGNILRCIEVASGDWMWILPDDDDLEPGAIRKILNAIHSGSHLDLIVFAIKPGQRGGIEVSNSTGFAEALDDWGRITFLPVCLYRVEKLKPNLNIGYNYAYSVIPFLAMILHGFESCSWRARFESGILVNPVSKGESTWTWIWSVNTAVVAELINTPSASRELLRMASHWHLGPIGLTHDFLKRRVHGSPGHSRTAYHHKLWLSSQSSFRQRLLAGCCKFISYLPAAPALALIEKLRQLMGRGSRNKRGGEEIFGQA